ncbi:dTDP-4-dehydrorhamnose 3,5-epimerase [Candidatus Pelagibacter sp.]|jgi:dTDP-4-dehydrorhamnose 3,5-epimerase|nr:dTDP-4-dehydrorhamnose 3,5-epimerase [Candidatus Pelagibacter sp.]
MKILKTPFKDLLVIENEKYKDSRGYFREVLVEKNLKKKFPFNIVSVSKKNVIRGLHYQKINPQGKYISVIQGKILDVVVDIRKNSKTFGKHFSIILSNENCKSIYIPEGFAHGFAALDKLNIVIYSCTKYRDKGSEQGILWNDKSLGINWSVRKPIVSKKDRKNPNFKNHI